MGSCSATYLEAIRFETVLSVTEAPSGRLNAAS